VKSGARQEKKSHTSDTNVEKAKVHVTELSLHRSFRYTFIQIMDVVARRIKLRFPPKHVRESMRSHAIARLRKKANATAFVEGFTVHLGENNSSEFLADGTWEPSMVRVLKREIRRGDVVLDVGAHIGYYTLIAAKLVGREGHVFAFEPDSSNFSLLTKNIQANHLKNVTLIQKAVSNRTGKIKLHLSEKDSLFHSVVYEEVGKQTIEVDTVCLDDYFRNCERKVNFIKMDIEGAEPLAIEGMRTLLEKSDNLKIVMEFNPFALRRAGIVPESHLESMLSYGFTLRMLSRAKPLTIPKLMQNMDIYYARVGDNVCTLFFDRKRKQPAR